MAHPTRPKHSTRPPAARRGWAAACGVLAAAATTVAPPPALAGPATAPGAATEAATDVAVRRHWQAIVQFYGDEATDRFTLNVFDKDATEEAEFVFRELWKYDRERKEWVKAMVPRQAARVLPAARKPPTAPADSQQLADLDIKIQDVGLYYAKWAVNGVPCTTYIRLGARARDRADPGRPPAGSIREDVPVNADRSERQVIPDPRYHTGEGSLPLPK